MKRPGDFEKFMGSLVTVRLYSPRGGSKEFAGRLISYKDGDVGIETGSGKAEFKKSEIALVRLRLEF